MKATYLHFNKSRIIFLIGLLLLVQQAKSGDFVLMDRTYTYSYPDPVNGGAFDCNVKNFSSMPSNWLSPDDYWHGHFYAYFQLIDIPTNNTVEFQLGFYQYYLYNGKDYYETCSLTRAGLTGKGDIKEIDYGSPANWWQHPNGGVNFAKVNEFEEAGLAIWSAMPGHVGIICPSASGGDDIAFAVRQYYEPCTIRVIIVGVSAGSTFKGWDYYLNGTCTPTHQPTPTYGIDGANNTTDKVVPSTDEYSYNADMSGAVSGTGQKLALTPGETVYFRTKKVSDCVLESYIQTLVVPGACTPQKQATPGYAIDYINERTDKVVPSTDEYAYSSDMSGAVSGTGVKLTLTPGQTVYFRTKQASDCLLASDIQTLVAPSRPDAPSVSIDYVNEKTIENISSSLQYSISPSYTNPVTGNGSKITLSPGQDVYFWVNATSGSFFSAVTHLVVPNRPVLSYAGFSTITTPLFTVQDVLPSGLTGFDLDHLTVTNGTAQNFRSGNTFDIVPDGVGEVRVTILPNVFGGASFGSNTVIVTYNPSAQQITPTYGIEYDFERTNKVVPVTDEYSYSATMSPAVSGNGQKLTLIPGQDVYFRTKAGNGLAASEIQHLIVPARPATPSFTIDFGFERTVEDIPTNVEYSASPSYTNIQSGTGTKIALTPGKDLYFWTKVTSSSFYSEVFHLVVPARPATPVVTINYATEKTAELITDDLEYSTSPSYTDVLAGDGNAVSLVPGQDVYFWKKVTSSSFYSEVFHLVVPVRPATPSVSIDYVNQKTTEIITSAIEYSTSPSYTDVQNGVGIAVPLNPGVDLYFWKKFTVSSFYSEVFHLVVPQQNLLNYNGPDTISDNKFTVQAVLVDEGASFGLGDLVITNGTAQNLQAGNLFDIVPATAGEVTVVIPANTISGNSFASNLVNVYYTGNTTGTPSYVDNGISLYPNPNHDGVVHIRMNIKSPAVVSLYSATGTFIRNEKMNDGKDPQFNVRDLQRGVYFIKIKTEDGVIRVQKLVLE
jgi:hypothetical protein